MKIKLKNFLGIFFLIFLISLVSGCGGIFAELDKEGNWVDEKGKVIPQARGVEIKVSEETARKIVEKYLSENYEAYSLGASTLEYEHGVFVWQVDTFIGSEGSGKEQLEPGEGKALALHVDVQTGDLYGLGCMQGPNPRKILAYYDPEKLKEWENKKLQEKEEIKGKERKMEKEEKNELEAKSNENNANNQVIRFGLFLLGIFLTGTGLISYIFYSRIEVIQREINKS